MNTITELEKIKFKGFFDKKKQAELPKDIEPTLENAYRVFKACESAAHTLDATKTLADHLRKKVAGDLDWDQLNTEDIAKFIELVRTF